jgi:hypothetical protein
MPARTKFRTNHPDSYIAPNGELMAACVEASSAEFKTANPVALFQSEITVAKEVKSNSTP